jgi:iron(III) transport system ATP-binding protein
MSAPRSLTRRSPRHACDPPAQVPAVDPIDVFEEDGPPRPDAIACRGVRKAFGDVAAVAGVDLSVPAGSLTAVLGPSGCGKTTLLRLVAGFERPDAGAVSIGGKTVADTDAGRAGMFVAPERRRVGMVFQDYALFPHLDVAGNVGYALGRRPDGRRIAELLELVGLDGLGARRPHELSGGQQQRVALARALAPRPEVVLLDEPFSNLDAVLRAQVRGELRRILKESGVSGLLVTHDQEEALSLADRVAIMRAGVVEQAGTPEEVYLGPASRWVASFLGAVDVLPGSADGEGRVETELGVVPDGARHRGAVDVLIRPEALGLGARYEAGPDALPCRVIEREYYGHDQVLVVELEGSGHRLRWRGLGINPWHPGDRAWLWLQGPVSVLPARAA